MYGLVRGDRGTVIHKPGANGVYWVEIDGPQALIPIAASLLKTITDKQN
jgi:hypothetical protein